MLQCPFKGGNSSDRFSEVNQATYFSSLTLPPCSHITLFVKVSKNVQLHFCEGNDKRELFWKYFLEEKKLMKKRVYLLSLLKFKNTLLKNFVQITLGWTETKKYPFVALL